MERAALSDHSRGEGRVETMGSKRVHIAEETLRELYIDKQMSQRQIAKHLDCSLTAVQAKMRLYGMSLRSVAETMALRDDLVIPFEELRRLYIDEKRTQKQIAEHFGCSQQAIQRHMKKLNLEARDTSEANMLRNDSFRRDFDGSLSLKAYMLAFCKGDTHPWIRDPKSQTVRIMTSTTKQAQIDLFQNLFSPYGHVYIGQPDTRDATHMAAFINLSFKFLLYKEDNIPDWVLEDEEAFFGYLAGYTDAEGHITVSGGYAMFKIDTYDQNIILTCAAMLNRLGIKTSTPFISTKQGTITGQGHAYRKDMWRLHIGGKSALLLLFNRLRPYLRHATRIEQMNAAIANIEHRNTTPHKKTGPKPKLKETVSQ
jgi:biotin operon repressor